VSPILAEQLEPRDDRPLDIRNTGGTERRLWVRLVPAMLTATDCSKVSSVSSVDVVDGAHDMGRNRRARSSAAAEL
jgi:hypothetical protein